MSSADVEALRTAGPVVVAQPGHMLAEDAPTLTVEAVDVDAVYEAVSRQGCEVVLSLRDEEWGVRRFFVRDPDGRVVNVMSPPGISPHPDEITTLRE